MEVLGVGPELGPNTVFLLKKMENNSILGDFAVIFWDVFSLT
jgi:hypothetical protein